MGEIEKAYYRNKSRSILEALREKQYEAYFFETAAEARNFILDQVNPNEIVGIGGSVTVREGIGIVEGLKKQGSTIYDHWEAGSDSVRRLELKRKQREVDVFLSGINAITTDGVIVNLDAGGNRVACLCSGPKKVIAVTGVNKIVDSVDAAIHRTRHEAAVINAMRLNRKTPCVETGLCSDCNATERICAALLILLKKPTDVDQFTVVLVNEQMGY